jgi:hypothetical protein
MRIDGWLPGAGGGAVNGSPERGGSPARGACAFDEAEDEPETVRDDVGNNGDEEGDDTSRETDELSPAETVGNMRLAPAELAPDEEVGADDGAMVTVRETVLSSDLLASDLLLPAFAGLAFGGGALLFAMIASCYPPGSGQVT